MMQEGQILCSPTPTENPWELNAVTTATTNITTPHAPPTETHIQAEPEMLGASVNDEINEGKLIRDRKQEAQWEKCRQRKVSEIVTDERGEGDLKDRRFDGTGNEDQRTEEKGEGEREWTREEGCISMKESSVGRTTVCQMERMKEDIEGKNEKTQLFVEDLQQADRLVH